MDRTVKKKAPLRLWAMALPLGLSAAAAVRTDLILAAVSVPLLFVALKLLPWCRKRENLGMFCLVTLWSIPFNLFAVKRCLPLFFDSTLPLILRLLRLLWLPMIYAALFSLEQLAFGLVVKFFCRRQYPFPNMEAEE